MAYRPKDQQSVQRDGQWQTCRPFSLFDLTHSLSQIYLQINLSRPVAAVRHICSGERVHFTYEAVNITDAAPDGQTRHEKKACVCTAACCAPRTCARYARFTVSQVMTSRLQRTHPVGSEAETVVTVRCFIGSERYKLSEADERLQSLQGLYSEDLVTRDSMHLDLVSSLHVSV